MFAAILILFALPWLDRCKVRSGTFRPIFKQFYWLLVIDVIVLGVVGAKPAEGVWLIVGRIATAYYFFHFLILLPILSKVEKTRPLPESISQAVLAKHA
jgi:ubiquinol-cytochrome c reductase cytochrome b/c1 subunit